MAVVDVDEIHTDDCIALPPNRLEIDRILDVPTTVIDKDPVPATLCAETLLMDESILNNTDRDPMLALVVVTTSDATDLTPSTLIATLHETLLIDTHCEDMPAVTPIRA